MKFLLITPPFVQLNTPYPATTQLKAFLKQNGYDVLQADLGIELAERIFEKSFIEITFKKAFLSERLSKRAQQIACNYKDYINTIDAVWRFLRGKDDTLANRIVSRTYLPEAFLFKNLNDEDLDWAYGTTGTGDRAKYFATLYIEELADFVAEVYDCDFSLIRYNEQICLSAPSFDPIYNELDKPLNIIETMALDLFNEKISAFGPDVVGFSLPFPGTVVMALRMAQFSKKHYPDISLITGGGYVNTELRQISDPRFFEFFDFVLFDDGELPIISVADYLQGKIEKAGMISTKYLEGDKVIDSLNWDNAIDFNDLPPADFSDLHMDKYVSLVELTNPMHKLWTDGRWNKMTLAHGCYHAKCAFCDTKLDYIGRYSPARADKVVDRMEAIMGQTGLSGFHFTDEALPPKLLKDVAQIIIDRGLTVSFWGNIRFEKSYNLEACQLLAKAGMIAVSGGLEVASPRILKLINKGVTIEQAISACEAFSESGIMVHTYLMYGFPTQTEREAVESLEVVRGMFENGLVQSAFWHRFSMTIHSPTGHEPEKYSSKIINPSPNPFANNAVEFDDGSTVDWDRIGRGLKVATQNYMQFRGFDMPVKKWFKN